MRELSEKEQEGYKLYASEYRRKYQKIISVEKKLNKLRKDKEEVAELLVAKLGVSHEELQKILFFPKVKKYS